MAYRIHYGPMKAKRNVKRNIVIILGLILMLTGVYFVKKEPQLFLPGDPAVTAAALDNLSSGIAGGVSFEDAFFCFCQEIIDGANLPY